MVADYILSLDQGTSSSRAVVFDRFQNPVGMEQIEFKQYYPSPGWVEHNPEEIWETQLMAAKNVLKKLNVEPERVAAISIANQRETTIIWDRKTGRPIHNAIVWQDRRTADICEMLRNKGHEDYIRQSTGLVIDSYFSATKLYWILNNIPGAMKLAQKGQLAFGTVDTWLLWKLTGGNVHATDTSNASRTMLFNIASMAWDTSILEVLKIPQAVLPTVMPSSGVFGHTIPGLFGSSQIPIAGIAGDQQAALFGQRCFEQGEVKNTYGTGCFMLMNTGGKPVISNSGLLATVAWTIGNETCYALEGSIFIAGAAIKWLRDGLKIINNASETEEVALSVPDSQGVYIVPAFTGLGAPHWDMYARGAIMGLTQGVTEKHIVRATLESLAYQTLDIIGLMESTSKIPLKSLKADGGASSNGFLMQFQADMLRVEVVCSPTPEATALGSAMLAGLAVELYPMNDLKIKVPGSKVFKPNMSKTRRDELYKGWLKAVERVKLWDK